MFADACDLVWSIATESSRSNTADRLSTRWIALRPAVPGPAPPHELSAVGLYRLHGFGSSAFRKEDLSVAEIN